jgi:hypothetical protein
MLIRHLICGIVIGVRSALAGALAGFPVSGIAGFYAVGLGAGAGSSLLVALSCREPRVDEAASADQLRPQSEASLTPAE